MKKLDKLYLALVATVLAILLALWVVDIVSGNATPAARSALAMALIVGLPAAVFLFLPAQNVVKLGASLCVLALMDYAATYRLGLQEEMYIQGDFLWFTLMVVGSSAFWWWRSHHGDSD